MQQKILPLTRSNQFLNTITSFAGLIERFIHPDLTLYCTLTRKRIINPEASSLEHSDGTVSRVYSDEAGSLEHSDEGDSLVVHSDEASSPELSDEAGR